MRVRNLHSAFIEGIAPNAEGHVIDNPAARAMERAGMLKVLDRDATPPPPPATPEAMAKLSQEIDATKHALSLAHTEIEKQRAAIASIEDEKATLATRLASMPADIAQASEQIAQLQKDLAAAHALLEEAGKKSKGK